MAGFDNDTMYADNVDFTGSDTVTGQVTAAGELLIGSSTEPNIRVSTLTAGTGVSITNGDGTIEVAGSDAVPLSFPTDSGTATPASNSVSVLGGQLVNTSGSGSTVTVNMDDPLWIALEGGFAYNLGFTLSAGTFTLTGATAALSASNPAYAVLRDKSVLNQWKLYTITADQSFDDASAAGGSDITGNLWSTVTTVAFGANRPFFVYLVANDDEDTLQAMLSDSPTATQSPAAANIGAPDDAVADAQGDFWSFDAIDETLYDGNPCLSLGAIRMQKDGSDDWTIQTLSKQDGPGRFQEMTDFALPRGQFGAATNSYVLANAGTEPTSAADGLCKYRLDKYGWVDAIYNIVVDNSPSGAQNVEIVLPYIEYQSGTAITFNYANGYWLDGGISKLFRYALTIDSRNVGSFILDNGSTILTNASFASSDAIRFVIRYRAFDTNEP